MAFTGIDLGQYDNIYQDRRSHLCDIPGCNRTFLSEVGLSHHKNIAHSSITFDLTNVSTVGLSHPGGIIAATPTPASVSMPSNAPVMSHVRGPTMPPAQPLQMPPSKLNY
jgi:hypothetical protein